MYIKFSLSFSKTFKGHYTEYRSLQIALHLRTNADISSISDIRGLTAAVKKIQYNAEIY